MEAMAVESLVSAVWRLEDYLTVVRHPVRVAGGYSDVDVVGVKADRCVRVAECKARGPARRVNVESATHKWSQRWNDSLANIPRLFGDDRPQWLPRIEDVTTIEFHLVGNIWFPNTSERDAAEEQLSAALASAMQPLRSVRTVARIFSTADCVMRAIAGVRNEVVNEKWGKRYGDPILDAVRELVRYANPRVAGARGMAKQIQDSTKEQLITALFANAEDEDPD